MQEKPSGTKRHTPVGGNRRTDTGALAWKGTGALGTQGAAARWMCTDVRRRGRLARQRVTSTCHLHVMDERHHETHHFERSSNVSSLTAPRGGCENFARMRALRSRDRPRPCFFLASDAPTHERACVNSSSRLPWGHRKLLSVPPSAASRGPWWPWAC